MTGTQRRFVRLLPGHREQNLEAAQIIVSAAACFGGRFSGLVQWSRVTLRREQARLNRLRARQVAA